MQVSREQERIFLFTLIKENLERVIVTESELMEFIAECYAKQQRESNNELS